MKNKAFSYEKITAYIRNLKENELLSKKPETVHISVYQYHQTIVVRGHKDNYQHLIEFWVSFMSWFHEDEIEYSDFSKFSCEEILEHFLSQKNLIGICQEIELPTIHFHGNDFLNYIDSETILRAFLMDPTWNSKKLLAITENYFYAYNWWTGE